MAARLACLILPALLLGGCEMVQRLDWGQSCEAFFEHSREDRLDDRGLRRVCQCAIDRELAGDQPRASVPARGTPELPEFRRHIPDCAAVMGSSADGIAARESAGPAPRPDIFDPATGRVSDAPGQVRPNDGAPATPMVSPNLDFDPNSIIRDAERAYEEAERDVANSVRR